MNALVGSRYEIMTTTFPAAASTKQQEKAMRIASRVRLLNYFFTPRTVSFALVKLTIKLERVAAPLPLFSPRGATATSSQGLTQPKPSNLRWDSPEFFIVCRCLVKAAEPAATPAPAGASANRKNARLAKGETLTQISKQHGVSVEEIQQLNKIEDAKKLQACQTIKIPFTTPQPASGRVVGAPFHGPESARKSDDDLLSNAKI